MPVVNLSFVADDGEEIIFVQRIRAGIPLTRWIIYVLAVQNAVTYGKGSGAAAFALLFIGPFPPPLTTNVV